MSRDHIWTQGIYKVKPGCAEEFVRGWRELARHAVEEFGVAPATILYDREDPSLYVTFGVWDSLDTLQRFRSSPLVAERASALDDLLDSAEARVLEEVAYAPARGQADSSAAVEVVQAEEWDWSRTVVDHLDLHASDFSESVRFYETILAPLAIPKLYERDGEACFTHVNVVAQKPPTKELHLCFYARSKRRSMRSTVLVWKRASARTERRVTAITLRATTPRTCSTPTGTTSRRSTATWAIPATPASPSRLDRRRR